jgi:phage tail-like protein
MAFSNEPGVAPNWELYWTAVTPSWEGWLFDRLPSWTKVLDDVSGNPLKRFLSILGHAMNQTQQEVHDFPRIVDPELMPAQYISHLGTTLGMLLPHKANDRAQRQLLSNIIAVYRHKGTVTSLKFLALQYLDILIDIENIDPIAHRYDVVVTDWGTVAIDDQPDVTKELGRLVDLYGPAGWVTSLSSADAPSADVGSILNISGDLNVSFILAG